MATRSPIKQLAISCGGMASNPAGPQAADVLENLRQVAPGSPAAIDFTTIEVWTKSGLVTYASSVRDGSIDVTRSFCRLHGESDRDLDRRQIVRNLTDIDDGFLNGTRYLIMDRDSKFIAVFRQALEDEGIHSVRLPPRSPNLTPHIERFFRSLKQECLKRMVFFGEASLSQRRASVSGTLSSKTAIIRA